MNWHWGGFVGGLIGTTVISPLLAVVAVNCWERWHLASTRRKGATQVAVSRAVGVSPTVTAEHLRADDGCCAACGYDWPCPTVRPETWEHIGRGTYVWAGSAVAWTD